MNTIQLRIAILYLITNMALSPYSFYFTQYMGQDVYHGDPTAPENSTDYKNFDDGVRYGSLSVGLMSLLTMIFSLMITPITKCGYKGIYIVAHVTGSFCVFAMLFTLFQTPLASFFFGAGIFILNTVQSIIPFTLMSLAVEEKDMGFYVGVLNTIQVVGQILSNFVASTIMTLCAPLGIGAIAPGLGSSGAWGMIGIPIIILLIIPRGNNIYNNN